MINSNLIIHSIKFIHFILIKTILNDYYLIIPLLQMIQLYVAIIKMYIFNLFLIYIPTIIYQNECHLIID